MKKWVTAFLLLSIFATNAFSQNNMPFTDSLISKLKIYTSNNVAEKVYLQLDKPFYATGDTVYFKAYVTIGNEHKLSAVSSLLHVDLITPLNTVFSSRLLRLENGLAWGDFSIPDSLKTGNYRIRAYTTYMDTDNHFTMVLPISSLNSVIQTVSPLPKTADFQIFPEGGNLVNDVRSRIGFKAVGTDGFGADISGVLTDNGKVLSTFKSTHLGMGSFSMIPEDGHSYVLKYKLKDSVLRTMPLPLPLKNGITIAASTADISKLSVTIKANPLYFGQNKNKNYTVAIYAGGKLTYVNTRLESTELGFNVATEKLPSGIARITLFNESGQPLAERLVFIQNRLDVPGLLIAGDKQQYAKREKVELNITNTAAIEDKTAALSISVVDESKVPQNVKGSNIYTYSLLTSELKGFIEEPDYYFRNQTDETLADLNVLMLTQGYRRFTWQQIQAATPKSTPFAAETGTDLTGSIRTLNGKNTIPGSKVNLIIPKGPVLNTVADSAGNFRFKDILVADSTNLILSATNANGRNNTLIRLNNSKPKPLPVERSTDPEKAPDVTEAYVQNAQLQKAAEATYAPLKGKVLGEVKINAYRSSNYGGAGHADQVLNLGDKLLGGPLETVLNGRLRNVVIQNGYAFLNTYNRGPMLVVIDGVQVNSVNSGITRAANRESSTTEFNVPGVLTSLNPMDIETVEVLKYANAAIYGLGSSNGVLVITTRQGDTKSYVDRPATGLIPFKASGFYVVREFYSPKYEPNMPQSSKPDFRSTIFWNPDLRLNKSGKGSFNFYNADGAGIYRVTIEGVAHNGNLIHTEYRYKVE